MHEIGGIPLIGWVEGNLAVPRKLPFGNMSHILNMGRELHMTDATHRRILGWWSMKLKMLSTVDRIILPVLGVGSIMAGAATYMLVF